MSKIRELCTRVFRTLGPGYSERVYHNAMEVLLRQNGIPYETEVIIPIVFEKHTIGNLRGDLVVCGEVLVELKATRSLTAQNSMQVRNYMKLTGLQNALLVNFPQMETAQDCEFEEVSHSSVSSEGGGEQ